MLLPLLLSLQPLLLPLQPLLLPPLPLLLPLLLLLLLLLQLLLLLLLLSLPRPPFPHTWAVEDPLRNGGAAVLSREGLAGPGPERANGDGQPCLG
jgi:hypothetical protein